VTYNVFAIGPNGKWHVEGWQRTHGQAQIMAGDVNKRVGWGAIIEANDGRGVYTKLAQDAMDAMERGAGTEYGRRNPALHKVENIGPNQTEVTHGDVTALISYQTPVAVKVRTHAGVGVLATEFPIYYKTSKAWSNTTAHHIGAWLRSRGIDPKDVMEVPQADIEKMLATGRSLFRKRAARNPTLAILGNPAGDLPPWEGEPWRGFRVGQRIKFWNYAGRGMRGPEYKEVTGTVRIVNTDSVVVTLPGDRYGARPVVVNESNINYPGGGETIRQTVTRNPGRNPTLAILGNPEGRRGTLGRGSPRGALSETAGLDELILRLYEVANTKSLPESDRKKLEEAGRIAYELWHQARRGVHRNPGRKKIARKVLAIDYVHASDGKKYTHDFTEDSDHGPVCAYVEDGGRRVVLEAADGKPIVGDY